jgi:hypothetical protein
MRRASDYQFLDFVPVLVLTDMATRLYDLLNRGPTSRDTTSVAVSPSLRILEGRHLMIMGPDMLIWKAWVLTGIQCEDLSQSGVFVYL